MYELCEGLCVGATGTSWNTTVWLRYHYMLLGDIDYMYMVWILLSFVSGYNGRHGMKAATNASKRSLGNESKERLHQNPFFSFHHENDKRSAKSCCMHVNQIGAMYHHTPSTPSEKSCRSQINQHFTPAFV